MPSYAGYVQGGESSLTNGTEGISVITVTNIVPNYYLSEGNRSVFLPVEFLPKYSYPLNAAVVFSGSDGESESLVEITNLSLSDGNTSLILQVKPLKNYEGDVLKSFTSDTNGLDTIKVSTFKRTRVYFEMKQTTPENANGCPAHDPECIMSWDHCMYWVDGHCYVCY